MTLRPPIGNTWLSDSADNINIHTLCIHHMENLMTPIDLLIIMYIVAGIASWAYFVWKK